MKISSIRIENFRSFSDETISIHDYSCFVGPNGAGKSNVLAALNIFFQNPTISTPVVSELDEEDFHNKDTANPIRITVTFIDFSPEAKKELKNYIRQDQLTVTAEAVWKESKGSAPVEQHGQRLGMEEFAEYFRKERDKATAQELKAVYADLQKNFEDLPKATSKGAIAEALNEFEANNSDKCVLLKSSHQFYGANKGKLNAFVQWIYVPAVKDASEEGEESKKSALGQLLSRTVRAKTDFGTKVENLKRETFKKYEDLLEENQTILSDVSKRLKQRLEGWSHTDANLDLKWISNKEKSVQVVEPVAGVFTGEGDFSGSLSRMGHGLQRSYLLALLTELADLESENEKASTLILACEEPELYQHPPQARRLADVFRKLADTSTQIMVTTHSPYFVSGEGYSDVRLIRKNNGNGSFVSQSCEKDLASFINNYSKHKERFNPQGIRAKIYQSLQPSLNEMFFCRFPVFVEGLEDVAFINSGLHLFDLWDEFHALGCHLIPANGKNHLVHPVAIAKQFSIPHFLVFDCDDNEKDVGNRNKHELDNGTLLQLMELNSDDVFPVDGIKNVNCWAWQTNMGESIQADFKKTDLDKYFEAARTYCGNAKYLDKNGVFISEWLTCAFEEGNESITLRELCQAVISAAQ